MPLDSLRDVSEALWRIPSHLRWDSYESVGEYIFAVLTVVFGVGVSFVSLMFMLVILGSSLLGNELTTQIIAIELPFIGAVVPYAVFTGAVSSGLVGSGFAPFTDRREDLQDDAAIGFFVSFLALVALGAFFILVPEFAPADAWVSAVVLTIAGAYLITIGGYIWRAVQGYRR